jgi:tetratricopeptide (TPR) repeat protein
MLRDNDPERLPSSLQRLSVPRSVANLVVLICTVLLIRRFVQVHLNIQVSTLEAIGFPLAVALAGVFFKYLPVDAREWVGSSVTALLGSLRTTRVSIGMLVLVLILAISISTIAVSWTGPPEIEIFKNGQQLTPSIGGNRHSLTLFTASFWPTRIIIKSYSTTVRPLPLKQSHVVVPFYVTAADIPELGTVEDYLDLALLQQTPARYIREASSRLAHLRQVNTGVNGEALERLEDIVNILDNALVEARDTDIKDYLVETYREKYPYDSWVKPLEAAVAFSEYKYQDVINILNAFNSPGARRPRLNTVHFFKATAYLRLANQQRIAESSNNESVSNLAAAEREYDAIIAQMLRNGDHEYLSTIRPAAYIFRGITAFYQRDYSSARANFETVLRLDEADSTLKGRAENGIGYLALLRGDLKDASRDFQRALDFDGSIAIARVNLGYLFLMQGRYKPAEEHFKRLLSDPRIKLKSPRDILLANLALGHALDEGGNKEQALQIYTDLLTGLNQHDYTEVQDAELRWAYVYNAIGSKVYLFNRDYFGLEPFALAMFGKSCFYLCRSRLGQDAPDLTDTDSELKEELSKNIAKAQTLARLEWSDSFAVPQGLLNSAAGLLHNRCLCATEKQQH